MMQKLQRFGAAMFTPVLLFAFAGIMTAICTLMTNQEIFGSIAATTTNWYGIWSTLQAGAFTVFNIIPLLFVVGLPIGLAKKSGGRAAMEAVVIYASWNYMINAILTHWGSIFGFKNFSNIQILSNSTNQGLTNIIGIKTLDTSILGALVVAGIAVWLHNKYFDKKLPDWLGTFQGSAYIVILGYIAMIPLAIVTCMIWPKVQLGISALQGFMKTSGVLGVWVYCFLERFLIPTGLHHFIYIPFLYGPAVVSNGLVATWFTKLSTFAASTKPLKVLAPEWGFALFGNEKVFGVPAICLAFYMTAKANKKKETAALLIPAGLTSLLAGITEPVEFTFLFAAPVLWVIHSILAATMDATMYAFGVVGEFDGGLIGFATENWIPLWENHWITWVTQIIIGLIFALIYFFVFKFMILKFNYVTPGREPDDSSAELISKKEYKSRTSNEHSTSEKSNPYLERSEAYLQLLGGTHNITEITSCATRLRVSINDESKVGSDSQFRANKASGVVRHGKAIQVIVGLDVPQVLETIKGLMSNSDVEIKQAETSQNIDEFSNEAALISDALGTSSNILSTHANSDELIIKVKDTLKVDEPDVFKELNIGIQNISSSSNIISIKIKNAEKISKRIKDNII